MKLCKAAETIRGYIEGYQAKGLPHIEACRDVNGRRHEFAIHDVCRSGNQVLRHGGNHTIRLLGRKAILRRLDLFERCMGSRGLDKRSMWPILNRPIDRAAAMEGWLKAGGVALWVSFREPERRA